MIIIGYILVSPAHASAFSAQGVRLTAYGLSGNDRVLVALYDFELEVWNGKNPSKGDVWDAYNRQPNNWVVLTPNNYQREKIYINHIYVFIIPGESWAPVAYDSASTPLNLPSTVYTGWHYDIRVKIFWGQIQYGCIGNICFDPVF